jgi:hypothetical protein
MRVLALLAIICLIATSFAMTESEVASTVEKVHIIKLKFLDVLKQIRKNFISHHCLINGS